MSEAEREPRSNPLGYARDQALLSGGAAERGGVSEAV